MTDGDGAGEETTVLLIDADADTGFILRSMFRRAGVRLLIAQSREEGLEFARATRPRAVITSELELNPEEWSTTRTLKTDPATADIPVVVFTACVLPGAEDAAKRCGCDAFLTKPAPPREVLRVVQNLLRS